MSDFIPKAGGIKIGGLGPKAQKLQAMREKAERMKSGVKAAPGASTASVEAKELRLSVMGVRDSRIPRPQHSWSIIQRPRTGWRACPLSALKRASGARAW